MSKTPFRETLIYPIIFVLVISIVFVGILALLYRSNEAKIMRNREESYQKLVLQVMAEKIATSAQVEPATLINGFPDSFHQYIKEIKVPDANRRYFEAVVNGQTVAVCYQINGKGLWGSMTALAAFEPDLKTMLGLAIYDQMETPGLGARIEESWFLDQFRKLSIIRSTPVADNYVNDFELIPEGSERSNPTQIQQVTGATITSRAVTDMLTKEVNAIYKNHLQQVKQ